MKLKDVLEILNDNETLEQFDEEKQEWSEVAAWFLPIAKHREFRIKQIEKYNGKINVEIAGGPALDEVEKGIGE